MGFLGSVEGRQFPFAVMWANRMPRRVLPVKRAELLVIEGDRLVPSDVEDFVSLIQYLPSDISRARIICGSTGNHISDLDLTFFVRELGLAAAEEAPDARASGWRPTGLAGCTWRRSSHPATLCRMCARSGSMPLPTTCSCPIGKANSYRTIRFPAAPCAAEWPGRCAGGGAAPASRRCRRAGTPRREAPTSAPRDPISIPGGRWWWAFIHQSCSGRRCGARARSKACLVPRRLVERVERRTLPGARHPLACAGWRLCATAEDRGTRPRHR